jgi:hypothetical protein
MKVNTSFILISVAMSALLAYGLYAYAPEENKELLTIGGFISFLTTLAFTLGVQFEYPRTTTNIRALSSVFFLFTLIGNVVFARMTFSPPSYIITTGIILCIYLIIFMGIKRAAQ